MLVDIKKNMKKIKVVKKTLQFCSQDRQYCHQDLQQSTNHPYIPNVPNPYAQQQAYTTHHLGGSNHGQQHNIHGQDGRSPRQGHQPELCGFQGDVNEKNQVGTESSISLDTAFTLRTRWEVSLMLGTYTECLNQARTRKGFLT